MSRPTAISPEEQEQIARKIGVLLLQGAPEDWQEITVEYRATGEYTDLLGELTAQDGSSRRLDPPAELREIFERLREGMYRPDVGTWLSALYVVERPSSYRIDINFDTEPQWQRPLPRAAYVDELNRYPRAEENIPDWLRERLEGTAPEGGSDAVPATSATTGPAEQAGDFRFANVFDGVDEEGRPVVARRRPVPSDEVASLRQYLENAPVVLDSRENEEDMLAADRDRSVPGTWHTDGTWLWPGAVAYYLSQYGMPPETALVDHVRSRGFQLQQLDEATRAAALRELTEQPDDHADDVADAAPHRDQQPVVTEEADVDEQLEGVPAASGSRHQLDESDDVPDTQEVLAQLHDRLTGYQVDSADYRIGSTSDDARCLIQDGEDWAVVGGGEDVRFTRVDHAASFLLGRLLLDKQAPAAPATSAATAAPVASAPSTTAPVGAAAVAAAATSAAVPAMSSSAGSDAETSDSGLADSATAESSASALVDDSQTTPESASTESDELLTASAAERASTESPLESGSTTSQDESEEPARTPSESDLPQRGSAVQETAAELPRRSVEDSASDLPKRVPQEPEVPRTPSAPSTGGNPLFTANQDPTPPAEPPQVSGQQAPPMDRPLPPQAPQSPPVGQPVQPPNGAPGAGPLPKRQPRRDTGAPVPPPSAPQSGPAGQRPGPGGSGMTGPNRQGPPPAPPRPPQGQQPPAAQPPQGQQQGQQIQPLNGEPPLTLFRDRRIVMLQPGTELDRFGEPNGNVLYTARTPYTHRSLPPQWSSRPYAAFRVQRPIQALRGTAVPWFEQPGGGTAFVLPGPISELLADGTLAEMPVNERPPME